MLNLGLEHLTPKPTYSGITADITRAEVLKLIDGMYSVFGPNYKPLVDQLVAKACGYQMEQLSSLESIDLNIAIAGQLSTLSAEGFFKNLWSGLKWRVLSVDSHLKKLQQVANKLKSVSDGAFDAATLGSKVVSYQEHVKCMAHVTKLYDDINKFDVGKAVTDATTKGKGDKDAVEQYISGAMETLKNKFDELGAEAQALAGNMHYSREADKSAKEYGYNRANTAKLLNDTREMIVKMANKLSAKQFETWNKQWDQYCKSMATLGFGRNARIATSVQVVYRAQHNAYCRTWWLLEQLFKNIYKVACSVPTKG